MLPKEDRYFMTKPELLDKITGLLGGRVAEEIVFGEVSTGAHNDFQRATNIARRMVTEFGMSEKLGPLQFGQTQGQVFLGRDIGHEQNYSDAIAYEIDLEVQRIIKECYEKARRVLTENRDKLDLIANTLLEVETLDAEQIKHLVEHGVLPERPNGNGNGNHSDHGGVKVNINSQKNDTPEEDSAKTEESGYASDDTAQKPENKDILASPQEKSLEDHSEKEEPKTGEDSLSADSDKKNDEKSN